MNAFAYLVNTLFDLYLMVVILRIWLQLARADFYNPFSQFIVKATHPIVAPMRRILPAVGGIDTASVVLALAVVIIKILLLSLIAGAQFDFATTLLFALVSVIKEAGVLLFWILIIRAILSWVSQGSNPFEYVLVQLTEPLLSPIRRIIPPMGGLDLSVLILMIGLNFLNMLLSQYIPYWAVA
ncbi:YggT family protein [Shewanella yunxiaonensis]|uniref:YggT family protein n=1 Tax=Shewanella yunxiaonensis TaxID=2829809 RepID=A0ABX7YV60_9GAMM|nr:MULTISPECIES: YggT family protein [Shewanella]MDF0532793.1 YggT family protein [Shewanella sp. A32]QUN06678.1 YggT family protein [Shewanella yunxiaonensis]